MLALRFDPAELPARALEGAAAELLAAAEEPTLEAVARAAGCTVYVVPGFQARGIVLPDGRIYVRQVRSERLQALAIAHEVAHWVLGRAATHGDVWTLALLLCGELSHAPCFAA